MEKKRITIIALTEMERLQLRKDVTAAWQRTGDHLLYLFPPCIVLGEGSDLKRHITLPERFTLTGMKGSNEWGSYIGFLENDSVSRIQEELGLPVIPTGLHISYNKDTVDFRTSVGSVRAYALQMAEYDGTSFRVIQQKRL